MKNYLKDAISNGGTKAAIEIHNSLVRSGAIMPSQTIVLEMASIIVKIRRIVKEALEGGER